MLKTRFDETKYWVTAQGLRLKIKEMETNHILNCIGMFLRRPTLIQNLLLKDIEDSKIWRCVNEDSSKRESIANITSMSIEVIFEWFRSCPLYNAFITELSNRGVNVNQMLLNFNEENSR